MRNAEFVLKRNGKKAALYATADNVNYPFKRFENSIQALSCSLREYFGCDALLDGVIFRLTGAFSPVLGLGLSISSCSFSDLLLDRIR